MPRPLAPQISRSECVWGTSSFQSSDHRYMKYPRAPKKAQTRKFTAQTATKMSPCVRRIQVHTKPRTRAAPKPIPKM